METKQEVKVKLTDEEIKQKQEEAKNITNEESKFYLIQLM
jgi:hypothetical protein